MTGSNPVVVTKISIIAFRAVSSLTFRQLCRQDSLNTGVWHDKNTHRSSHQRCSVKKGVLKNLANFTEKDLCWSLKKRLQHRCFPMNIAKFLRTSILKNICERVLPHTIKYTILTTKLNHLVSLAKWLTVRIQTNWLWFLNSVAFTWFSDIVLFWARRYLTFK